MALRLEAARLEVRLKRHGRRAAAARIRGAGDIHVVHEAKDHRDFAG
jgi:hypothetical protein